MLNFVIYFDVNLDYGQYYDAYASALQLTVLSCAMKMSIDKVSFAISIMNILTLKKVHFHGLSVR